MSTIFSTHDSTVDLTEPDSDSHSTVTVNSDSTTVDLTIVVSHSDCQVSPEITKPQHLHNLPKSARPYDLNSTISPYELDLMSSVDLMNSDRISPAQRSPPDIHIYENQMGDPLYSVSTPVKIKSIEPTLSSAMWSFSRDGKAESDESDSSLCWSPLPFPKKRMCLPDREKRVLKREDSWSPFTLPRKRMCLPERERDVSSRNVSSSFKLSFFFKIVFQTSLSHVYVHVLTSNFKFLF